MHAGNEVTVESVFGALYQDNPTQPLVLARLWCNLFMFGQTGPTIFRSAHMDWSAQQKTQNKTKDHNTYLPCRKQQQRPRQQQDECEQLGPCFCCI